MGNGFTDEELDFIINHDIKYRMGAYDGEEEEPVVPTRASAPQWNNWESRT